MPKTGPATTVRQPVSPGTPLPAVPPWRDPRAQSQERQRQTVDLPPLEPTPLAGRTPGTAHHWRTHAPREPQVHAPAHTRAGAQTTGTAHSRPAPARVQSWQAGGHHQEVPCPAPSTPAPRPAAPHQSPTAPADAPPTPETGTGHAAHGRHAAMTATTTAHAEPSHPSSPPAGPPAGGAAYPSTPANHGTSDTTTTTGPSPAAPSTPTPATAAPQDEQAKASHRADQAQRTAHHDHARNTQRADQQRCNSDASKMQASVQVTTLYQACTTSP